MDNQKFLNELLNHKYINLYHELIVSAQQGYLTRNPGWSEKQVAIFALEQAQETIKILGYTNGSEIESI